MPDVHVPRHPRPRGSLARGVMVTIFAAAAGGPALFVLTPLVVTNDPYASLLVVSLIGLVQLVWVVPLWLFHRAREPETAKGILVAAAVTALLNATCWGAVMMGVMVGA